MCTLAERLAITVKCLINIFAERIISASAHSLLSKSFHSSE